jgi:hypothetical protein
MTARLDLALRLRSHGYIPLPLSKSGRHLDLPALGFDPLHLRSRRKCLKELAFGSLAYFYAQRPPDDAALRSWFASHDGNIGILGGFEQLVILDFDAPQVFDSWRAEHAGLCASTPVEQSPHGFHVFIKCRELLTSTSLHIGFRRGGHIKALGGYVVATPSVLKDGSGYSWLEGQSPFLVEPRMVEDLGSLGIHATSPLKRSYDRLLGRGGFEPD